MSRFFRGGRAAGRHGESMSSPPVRRADKLMPRCQARRAAVHWLLWPPGHHQPGWLSLCLPAPVCLARRSGWLHNTSAHGHLQNNVRHDPRVCFEVSVPGKVFAYGRYECDTSIEYQSIVVFGRAAIIDDRTSKSLFFDALMAKYYSKRIQRAQRASIRAWTESRCTPSPSSASPGRSNVFLDSGAMASGRPYEVSRGFVPVAAPLRLQSSATLLPVSHRASRDAGNAA